MSLAGYATKRWGYLPVDDPPYRSWWAIGYRHGPPGGGIFYTAGLIQSEKLAQELVVFLNEKESDE